MLAGHNGGIKIGTDVVRCLFYADDLILMAPTRRGLGPLIRITESWATMHQLSINTEKTSYTIFNGHKGEPIRVNGNNVAPTESSTYLGYERGDKGSGSHMRQRIKKARGATFAIMSLFRRVPHLKPKVQAQIVQCCITATMMYGTEA
jgi:hypothetical protein